MFLFELFIQLVFLKVRFFIGGKKILFCIYFFENVKCYYKLLVKKFQFDFFLLDYYFLNVFDS